MNFKEKMCWNIQRKSLCNRGIWRPEHFRGMQNFKWQIIYFTINERILFMKKIVAIDLDGTLLHSDCTISSYSKEVIAEAVKNGRVILFGRLSEITKSNQKQKKAE